jgi:ribosomal protein L25 (general stress protein Ctc)
VRVVSVRWADPTAGTAHDAIKSADNQRGAVRAARREGRFMATQYPRGMNRVRTPRM